MFGLISQKKYDELKQEFDACKRVYDETIDQAAVRVDCLLGDIEELKAQLVEYEAAKARRSESAKRAAATRKFNKEQMNAKSDS